MSTFDDLVDDLSRDVQRAQPRDVLQFCANWFQTRLEEQRSRTRDLLARSSYSRDLPHDLHTDKPIRAPSHPSSPFGPPSNRPSIRGSVTLTHASPFGTLNVPGNALLSDNLGPPVFTFDGQELPPTSPLSTPHPTFPPPLNSNPFGAPPFSAPTGPDFLVPPDSAIFARRHSVSAESILVDSGTDDLLPSHPKTQQQLSRIKEAIADNLLFRDLDDEQESGVINAMQEVQAHKGDIVIRQGDAGDFFYVVETGMLNCYIRSTPLPASWALGPQEPAQGSLFPTDGDRFAENPTNHPDFGRRVAECGSGTSFGDLALMYGHPRAATVLAVESSTLWAIDRITFRTIILKAAHRRRTMYEQFLTTVPLLSSLDAQECSKIADALTSRVYSDGEAVVRQGEKGDTFFFVEEGQAVVTKRQEGEEEEAVVSTYKKGDYFGELSLLLLAPRAATVSAVVRPNPAQPKLKVAALDAAAFTRLLGPLRELMERQAAENYGPNPRWR